ncbi:MAG: UpxY family transcription antiterminator [Bacteroidales bacterium]|nr:UpxY family transcription antiterminator [Candidatus Physcocola equi]
MPNPQETSTENVPNSLQEKQLEPATVVDKDVCTWYVLKALWRQEDKAEERLKEAQVVTYIPRKLILKENRKHKKERMLVPVINSLVFVKSTIRRLEQVKEEIRTKYGQTLYFYTNHEGGRNVITSIPDAQMEQFRLACRLAGDAVQYFLPEELPLAKGTKVRIHGGPFEGHEGVLLKVKGKRSKNLVVSIEGFISAAVAEVNPEYIEVIS